jgi:signal peptidase I
MKTSRRPDRTETPARESWIRTLLREWVFPVALMLAITAPLRSAMADWYDVPTGSMKPTILEGDRIVVNNLAYGLRVPFTTKWVTHWNAPRRGEIVTLSSPVDHKRLVKRVIGLPGDHLSLSDGRLFLNGRPVIYERETAGDLPCVHEAGTLLFREELPGRAHLVRMLPNRRGWRDFPEVVVPSGRYFVMGDNRDESGDSRYFGLVEGGQIFGRASRVAMSFDPERHHLPRTDRWMKRLI